MELKGLKNMTNGNFPAFRYNLDLHISKENLVERRSVLSVQTHIVRRINRIVVRAVSVKLLILAPFRAFRMHNTHPVSPALRNVLANKNALQP